MLVINPSLAWVNTAPILAASWSIRLFNAPIHLEEFHLTDEFVQQVLYQLSSFSLLELWSLAVYILGHVLIAHMFDLLKAALNA